MRWLHDTLRRDPLRLQFIAVALLFVLLFLLYSWQSVSAHRARIEADLVYVNRLFVEGSRNTFINQNSRLLLIGEQLRRLGAMDDAERGRRFLDEMARADSGIAAFGLARADGQLVLVSGVAPGTPLPDLMQGEETRDSFRATLDTRGFSIGRPYRMPVLETWVIPMRVPLPEADGSIRWVMTAGLDLDGGNTLWGRTQLPEGMGLVLVRDDGYLQYGSRLDSRRLGPDAVQALYSRPQPAEQLEQVQQAASDPAGGIFVVDRPDFGGEVLSAAIRLPEFGLTAVTGQSLRLVYEQALRGLLLPATLMLLYLLASWGAYTLARRQQARHDEHLMHLAHHDPLTKLPNRAGVMDRLRQAIAMSVRRQRSAALLFVDLDNFKVINDTHGHRFGDELLCRVSGIFTEAVRPGDTVARLGGDEFLIVLPELVDDGDAKGVAERILQRFRQPIAIGDQLIHSSTSIGIAIGPRDSVDPEELMRHADIALYDAKGRGRQCYSFFDPRLNDAAQRRSEIEKHLRLGLARGELSIVYQPIFLPGQPAQLCGVEALVRWNSVELGPVPPDEFIRVAEEAGLICEVGHFVMRRATAEVAALVREFGYDIKLSVNVSANELREGRLGELVDLCLREARLAPRNLMLELTESVMIENLAVVKAQLIEVRRLGASVAVDDFGTGYSSLSYLNRLPITTLKIDRSFVRDLCADSEDRSLVRSIVALGHGLDMRVVAEGVESADQVEVLTALGCDQLQGYYFSRPVDLGKLRELLTPPAAASV